MSGLLLAAPWAQAADQGGTDFERDVRPILERHCFECHGPGREKGGVALHARHHALRETEGGEALFVPGDPEASLLVRRITSTAPDRRMPKDRDPLEPAEVETIRRWIARGADWPDDGPAPPPHWSYVPPVRPEPPAVRHPHWPRTPIDRFILARLEAVGVSPSPEADKARLLRRVSLDLVGLPPSVGEVDAFLADSRPDAFERAVERLLASPGFGERWASWWLDAARHADSDGYQRDGFRDVWMFRDWVIGALNDDMPFDRFTIEQLAGDLLDEPTDAQRIATGFHRNTLLNLEAGTDAEEDRIKQVIDRVNTTGTVWLGTSLQCAQCHHHKHDPITIREYYQVFAFFNQSPIEGRRMGEGMDEAKMFYVGDDLVLEPPAEWNARSRALEAAAKEARERWREWIDARWDTLADEPAPPGAAGDPAARERLARTPDRRTDADRAFVADRFFADDADLRELARSAERLEGELERLPAFRTRIMRDLDEPRVTRVLERGDFLTPGDVVAPGTPAVLHPFPDELPRNRLGLARWITSPRNPLTARVIVNRLWAEFFGTGIVATPEEFGSHGDPPSHPELLDWLAVAFVEDDGWSMKAMIRRIVTSAVYRQSAAVRPDARAQDPDNRLLAWFPGHRLPAEAIRDNALAISGLLSPRMGGPPVRPPQPPGVWRVTGEVDNTYRASEGEDRHRRAVYTIWRRHAPYPSLANFDAPDRGICTVRRSRSNSPLQALTLLNDPAFVEMTAAFARRIAGFPEAAIDAKLVRAFRTVLSRFPTSEELLVLRAAYDDEVVPGGTPEAGWFNVASVLLNLSETISRR